MMIKERGVITAAVLLGLSFGLGACVKTPTVSQVASDVSEVAAAVSDVASALSGSGLTVAQATAIKAAADKVSADAQAFSADVGSAPQTVSVATVEADLNALSQVAQANGVKNATAIDAAITVAVVAGEALVSDVQAQ